MINEKIIQIIVETIEGESVSVNINEENKVEKLYREALDKLQIDPGSATYELRFEEKILNLSNKLKEEGLKEGSVVVLQRRPVVG